jgi:hypothetical protein
MERFRSGSASSTPCLRPTHPSWSSNLENCAACMAELPGADLSSEELMVKVVPKRSDEFTCTSCFLVHHRSRLAERTESRMICRDCAD